MTGSAGRYGVFRDNRIFTTILVVLLIMHLIGDLVLGILAGLELAQLSAPGGEAHFYGDDLSALDMAMIFAGLGYLLMVFVTIVIFCIWKNRTCKNAWHLAPDAMTFTPAWAVGWYFIPIANLWKPFGAMREIIRVSCPVKPPLTLAGWWWALWIITSITSQISFRAALGEDLDTYLISNYVDVCSTPLAVALDIILLVLVRRITRDQLKQVGQLA
jgi:hypothetical protein